VLGDGIEHVLATSTGQVWVGYFDEGIYGNYGWGRADSEEPAGAYGIVRFSPGLKSAWHYPQYTGVGPWEPIDDCYALNVDDTCIWACYYSDFPVVRIRDDIVTGWHNDTGGARALAAAGSRVALCGGYGPDYDRLALGPSGLVWCSKEAVSHRCGLTGENLLRPVSCKHSSPPGRRPGKIAAWNVWLESAGTSCGRPTRRPWVRGIAIAWAWTPMRTACGVREPG
jgi:hypothetical protein